MAGNYNIATTVSTNNKSWVEPDDTSNKYTAFKNNVVDFITPTWSVVDSSINRYSNTVSVTVLASDRHYLESSL